VWLVYDFSDCGLSGDKRPTDTILHRDEMTGSGGGYFTLGSRLLYLLAVWTIWGVIMSRFVSVGCNWTFFCGVDFGYLVLS